MFLRVNLWTRNNCQNLYLNGKIFLTVSSILCPDKDAVYEEAFRILKHGGRLAISDIVLIENINSQLQERFRSTWAGCLGGAIFEENYWQIIGRAGFCEIQIVSRHTLTPTELKAMYLLFGLAALSCRP